MSPRFHVQLNGITILETDDEIAAQQTAKAYGISYTDELAPKPPKHRGEGIPPERRSNSLDAKLTPIWVIVGLGLIDLAMILGLLL